MIVTRKRPRKETVFNLLEITSKQRNTLPPVGPRKITSRAKGTLSNGPNKSEALVQVRAEKEATSSQKGFKKSEEALQDLFESDTESLDSGSDEATPKKKTPVLSPPVLSPVQRKKITAEKATVKVVISKCDKGLLQKTVQKKQKSKIPRKQLFKSPQVLSDDFTACTRIPSSEVVASTNKEPSFEAISDSHKKIGLEELYKKIPCRRKQIDTLTRLFESSDHHMYPAVFVYGNTATGKSLVIQKVLDVVKVPTAFVNCVECYTTPVLYETIIYQLSGYASTDVKLTRCDSLVQFVQLLQAVIDKRDNSCGWTCIVIDKAERLCEFQATVLPTLLRLQELCQRNICVILLSEVEWGKFRKTTGCFDPLVIHCPDYNKAEALEILSLDCPEDQPATLYGRFLDHLWQVFHTVCRNLSELRYLSLMLFPKYLAPITNGEIQLSENRKLWHHINPFFKQAMSNFYYHDINSVTKQFHNDSLGNSETNRGEELPYYTKFLLIASFLASYNSAKSDKRFFSEEKESKSKRSVKSKNKQSSTQLLGPKVFPLSRLLNIFHFITDNQCAPSVHLLSQVRLLASMNYLSCVSKTDLLENCKYKCMVPLDFVQHISR
ncbi:origin recognition complex subunit 5-like isoform X3 [Dysidea avara]